MKKILFSFLVLTSVLFAVDVPRLIGRVNDYAGIMSATERQKLDDALMAYEQETTNQIAVLTIGSLQGDSLEDLSIRVAEKWKLGQRGKNNGVLILIARDEHKVRIEVGYGLEEKITDAFSGQVIRSVIAPSFREEKYYQGIYSACYAIMQKAGDAFTADRYARPVYRVDQGGGQTAQFSEAKLQILFIVLLVFGLWANGSKRSILKKGFLGGLVLWALAFLLFGFPFSLVALGALFLFGWPFTLVMIVLAKLFDLFGGAYFLGGGMGRGFGGGSGGFSGGGGSFGGGGASGGW